MAPEMLMQGRCNVHGRPSRFPASKLRLLHELESQVQWRDPDQLTANEWPAVVVGAGPAGAAAAIALATRGHRVLLADRYRHPRDKVCGDGLIPDALRALERLGLGRAVAEIGHATSRFHLFSPSGVGFEVSGRFMTLERRILDTLLVREAVARGVTLGRVRVAGLTPSPDGATRVRVSGSSTSLRARAVIVASGVHRPAGLSSSLVSGAAIRCYARSEFPLEDMVACYDAGLLPGYGWAFPLGNGLS